MSSKQELQKADFKTVGVSRKDGKTKTYKVSGFVFFYNQRRWFLHYEEKEWKIIHPKTGYLATKDLTQGGAILKFTKCLSPTDANLLNRAIRSAREELKKAGITLPVNK